MQTNTTPTLESGKWPDFYAILEAKPELSDNDLRRIIGERYQEASSKMDHRDLSVRFYNQVLTQKVLPASRRILLNPEMRALYDDQLRLHREGSAEAISYHKFVVEVTNTKSTCLLDANELSILPSISGKASHAPLQALNVPGTPQRSHIENVAPTANLDATMPSVTPPGQSQSAKKSLPVAAIAGVAVLLLGAGGWFMTRSAPEVPAIPDISQAIANAKINAKNRVPSTAPPKSENKTPPLMKLNTLAKNSDFEDKISKDWNIQTTSGSAFLDDAYNNDAQSGRRVLNFWTEKVPAGEKAKNAKVTQKLANLKNGTYTLSAWMRRSGKQNDFYMFASDYGGPLRKLNIDLDVSNGWEQITLKDIKVTNGQCTIGFYCDNVDAWVNIDAVEFHLS